MRRTIGNFDVVANTVRGRLIAGLESNQVAVPATAKRNVKRSAKDRLVLLLYSFPFVSVFV